MRFLLILLFVLVVGGVQDEALYSGTIELPGFVVQTRAVLVALLALLAAFLGWLAWTYVSLDRKQSKEALSANLGTKAFKHPAPDE